MVATFRLIKTASNSGSASSDLVRILVDEIESTPTATSKAEEAVERQRRFLAAAHESASDSFIDVASLRERVIVSGTRDTKALHNDLAASVKIARC